MLADGDGLYLQISSTNAKSWIFRYSRKGKSREMGLGSLKAVGLAAARLKAAECRGLLADGIDPCAAREAERAQQAIEDARAITFDQCAEAFIASHRAAWKNQTASAKSGTKRLLLPMYSKARAAYPQIYPQLSRPCPHKSRLLSNCC